MHLSCCIFDEVPLSHLEAIEQLGPVGLVRRGLPGRAGPPVHTLHHYLPSRFCGQFPLGPCGHISIWLQRCVTCGCPSERSLSNKLMSKWGQELWRLAAGHHYSQRRAHAHVSTESRLTARRAALFSSDIDASIEYKIRREPNSKPGIEALKCTRRSGMLPWGITGDCPMQLLPAPMLHGCALLMRQAPLGPWQRA